MPLSATGRLIGIPRFSNASSTCPQPKRVIGSDWFFFIGAIGTFLGGFLGDKLSDRTGDKRWYFWIPAISLVLMVPLQLRPIWLQQRCWRFTSSSQYRFFQDVPWSVFCNDTGISDLEDASSCGGDITLRLKYYWNGTGANFSGLA